MPPNCYITTATFFYFCPVSLFLPQLFLDGLAACMAKDERIHYSTGLTLSRATEKIPRETDVDEDPEVAVEL